MKVVKEPFIKYEVETTCEEDDTIEECLCILDNISCTMAKYHCDTLDFGYPENPETISIRDIKGIMHILSNIKEVHSMY
jgi:hypothetical protein